MIFDSAPPNFRRPHLKLKTSAFALPPSYQNHLTLYLTLSQSSNMENEKGEIVDLYVNISSSHTSSNCSLPNPLHFPATNSLCAFSATSPASALLQTVSSKPKITRVCKSPSARSTRTAGTRARTRCMRCVGSLGVAERAMIV
jgi:hypothetical protein